MHLYPLVIMFSGLILHTSIRSDEREYSVSGSLQSFTTEENNARKTVAHIDAEIGHLLGPRLQAGGRFGLDWLSGQEASGTTSVLLNTYLNPGARNRLFLNISPGLVFGRIEDRGVRDLDFDGMTSQVELGAGVKCAVGENAVLKVEYRYRHVFRSKIPQYPHAQFETRESDFDQHSVVIGLSVFSRRGSN